MTSSIHQPHDKLVSQVLSDLEEAEAFFLAHLPTEITSQFDWSTLKLVKTSFIDEEFKKNEADILYRVLPTEAVLGESAAPAFLYLLFEHQSTPDKWMRRRLIRYMDRIWDKSFSDSPDQELLPPILPLVFYQGERSWTHSTDFTDLFPKYAANWGFVPQFTHFLIDQSGIGPDDVRGGLKAQVMQLLMLAAFHEQPAGQALRIAAELIPRMPLSVGTSFVRIFIVYVLATQEHKTVQEFAQALKEQPAAKGSNEIMSYAEELLLEGEARGEARGKIQGKIETIEGFIKANVDWSTIIVATGVDEDEFNRLKEELASLQKDGTDKADSTA